MSKKALVAIANGTEEIEAVCIIDTLVRGGAAVTVASVDGLQITASRGVKIVADALIADCKDIDYDLIVCPGGMPGAEHLRDSKILVEMLKAQKQAGKLYAAICASPICVLKTHGLLEHKKATCYPSMADQLPNTESANKSVVVDGNCITSKGPGTSLEFALELVNQLFGQQKRNDVAKAMLIA